MFVFNTKTKCIQNFSYQQKALSRFYFKMHIQNTYINLFQVERGNCNSTFTRDLQYYIHVYTWYFLSLFFFCFLFKLCERFVWQHDLNLVLRYILSVRFVHPIVVRICTYVYGMHFDRIVHFSHNNFCIFLVNTYT